MAIVQTIDFFPPVVDDPFIYGQIAAANALSDVYAMGGTPITALNLVGYPDDKLSLDWLGKIIEGGEERCRAAGAAILGGHTVRDAEIKFGYAVTGTIHPKRILTNAAARPGDKLVLTKALGTGFVTTAHKAGECPDDVFQADDPPHARCFNLSKNANSTTASTPLAKAASIGAQSIFEATTVEIFSPPYARAN